MKLLIIQTSLSPESRSSAMALVAYEDLTQQGIAVELLSLKDFELPLCDGGSAYNHPNVPVLNQKTEEADAILLAVPIHNYTPASSSKNLIEMLDKQRVNDKVVGFLVAAGSAGSYIAIMQLANSLMLDFRCTIVPRFAFAHFGDFKLGDAVPQDICNRIYDLNKKTISMAKALKNS